MVVLTHMAPVVHPTRKTEGKSIIVLFSFVIVSATLLAIMCVLEPVGEG